MSSQPSQDIGKVHFAYFALRPFCFADLQHIPQCQGIVAMFSLANFFIWEAFAGKRQLYLIPVIALHFSLQSTAFSKLLQLCMWDPMAWHYSNMAFWMELQRRKNGLHHPASEAELELSSEVYGCKRGHTFCESSHEALNP